MKITDLYEQLDNQELDVEILNLQEGRMDSQEKERIINKTMHKIEEAREGVKDTHTKKFPRLYRRKTGLLIIAAVLIMAFTVSAAEYFHLNGNLLNFLGVHSEVDEKKLESMGTDFNGNKNSAQKMEDRNNGVSIRAEQVVSDGETIYIYFDITLPDGTFTESDTDTTRIMKFYDNEYSVGGQKNAAIGEMVIQENETGHYYAIAEIEVGAVKAGEQKLAMTFRNLGYIEATDTSTNWINLISGEWKLEWQLEYKDVSQNYSVSEIIPADGGTIEIENVRLSPFSIRLSGLIHRGKSTADGIIAMDGIILTDDSCVDLFKIQYTDPGDDKLVMKGTFKNMVDTKNIAGVRVNGTDIIFGMKQTMQQ